MNETIFELVVNAALLIVGLITVIGAGLCIIYLLRFNRFLAPIATQISHSGKNLLVRLFRFLLNPSIMGTDAIIEDELESPLVVQPPSPPADRAVPDPKTESLNL